MVESTAEKEEKLKHLEHPEDHFLNVGADGFHHAADTLKSVHDSLLGKKGIHKLTLKADGAPSIVAGIHPETQRFFVGTKSVFNKTPKINYSEQDIDRNHGHAPGLAEKLKMALKHLPKVIHSGVHQGDYLHDKDMRSSDKDSVRFRANTVEHKVANKSEEAKKIKASKMGIAFHTTYKGKTMDSLKADFASKTVFSQHPDVHLLDLNRDFSKDKYTPHNQKAFLLNLQQADKIHKETPPYSVIAPHGETMKQYVNHTVRTGEKRTGDGYKNFLESKPKISNKSLIQHVEDNKEHFDNAFKMHTHIELAKNALIRSFHAPHGDHEFSTNGKPTKPEGYVAVTKKGRPTKLVDRSEFSKNNFAGAKDFGKK